MAGEIRGVNFADDLVAAVHDKDVREIAVSTDLIDLAPIELLPGQTLRSASEGRPTLTFRENTDGLRFSSDNTVIGINIVTSPTKRAIWNDYSVDSLGTIRLRSLRTSGRVQILAREKIRSGRIEVDGLEIHSSDTRNEREHPQDYGVGVLQGAFTLWNMQSDEEIVLTADLVNLSVGSFGSPVIGSGVFVSGAGHKGGRLNVQRLETNAIYVDGRIPKGTADQIAGGLFTVYGTFVDTVMNHGPVVTYGANDMALDNWGVVDRWVAKEKVTTFGPSGIGFVNFGSIRDLRMEAPIETFGQGARGFNVYGGTVERSEFDRIVTHGDGAVGVQISQPIGRMLVRRGIETFGGTGPSLVKGVVQNLPATALSIKPGGYADLISVNGNIETHGHETLPMEILGSVRSLHIRGVSFHGP